MAVVNLLTDALTTEPVILPLALISTTPKSLCMVTSPWRLLVPSISKLPVDDKLPLELISPLAVILPVMFKSSVKEIPSTEPPVDWNVSAITIPLELIFPLAVMWLNCTLSVVPTLWFPNEPLIEAASLEPLIEVIVSVVKAEVSTVSLSGINNLEVPNILVL